MKDFTNQICSVAMGRELEEDIIYEISKNDSDCVSKLGTKEDIYEGTDFTYDGIRMDITCNFSGKDHCIDLERSIYLTRYDVELKFGLRTGNKIKKFVEPVLVLGFDGLNYTTLEAVKEALVKMHKEIFEEGCDLYWETLDRLGIEI